LVADRSQVLDDEEWMPRLDVYRRDIGQGMTVGEVDELRACQRTISRIDVASVSETPAPARGRRV
jgi:hypothetical protein